ncbi:acetate--CoA ligase family protein [Abyssisolibacter fermentans]|uniref:acetate--CoA ligase family protein n=1 Tax=Abyssisolibacter fermentans TaxID=1766203 RepID=UPI00083018EE|nr:acetate--CoA ligase family protein [Abyssisolibacter fermentans]
MKLNKLLKPKSIAVVGASEKEGFSGATCKNLIQSELNDNVFFINPNRDTVMGKKCYTSLKDVSKTIDLVIICTPIKIVNKILEEAGELGCKAAIVYASGYSESGEEGRKIEAELVQICKKYDISLMGPNCMGFINYSNRIYSFGVQLDNYNKNGGIGLISQSGQICETLMFMSKVKLSYLISCGNSSVTQLEDYLDFLVEDKDTKVIAVYLEGLKNTPKFIETLRKAAIKGKPIVVLKSGRSEKAQEIATAHTGSLTGSDKSFDAIFEKFGVIRVDDIEELVQTAMFFSTIRKLPKKSNFASMNLSGGETTICADVADMYNISFPQFSDYTLDKLKEMLPDYSTPNNPLDMTASLSYDPDLYAEAIKVVMDDPMVDMVLLGVNIHDRLIEGDIVVPMTEGIVKVANMEGTKPVAVLSFFESTREKGIREKLESAGVPILPSAKNAFNVLKHLTNFINYDHKKRNLDVAISKTSDIKTKKVLSEEQSKKVISKYGIPTTKGLVITSEKELLEVNKEFKFPVVAKIESADIPHKSDAGGVMLNIKDEAELLEKYGQILKNAKNYSPEAKINGVLVQEMLPYGTEIILGINNDKQFGPMLLAGLGGVFVEVFEDVALYPVPLNEFEATEMLNKLKASKLFKGYRGNQPLDIQGVVDTMVKLSNLAYEMKDSIEEIDINPLFVYEEGKGVCAADALIVLNSDEKRQSYE